MDNSVVVIAAHADDEVLGCGGAISRFVKEGRSVHVLLLADGVSSRTTSENSSFIEVRRSAAELANNILGATSLTQLNLPDNRMDQLDLLDIVKLVEKFISQHHARTVLTHHSGDVNIDHQIVHEAVIVACRPQPSGTVRELLFFEIPSSTEWRPPSSGSMFNPNYFIDISDHMNVKLEALQAYSSELRAFPHARSIKAVQALANWRGATVGVDAAEAFVLGRKIIVRN